MSTLPASVTQLFPLISFSLITAVLAVAYYRFAQPGMVLAFWAVWLYKIREWYVRPPGSLDPNGDAIILWLERRSQRADFWLKPVLTCETCIAGQLTFWLYLLLMPYNTLSWLFCIALSSYIAPYLLNKL